MKSNWHLQVVAVMGLFMCVAVTSVNADEKKPAKEAPAASEADYQAIGKPGPEHAQLERLVGTWKCETTAYYNPEEPVKGKGTAKFSMVMGGRFLQQNFKGETAGEKYQGRGLSGYDRVQKKFVGSWIDSMSTSIMVTEGKYDPQSHSLVEFGVGQMPSGPVKMKLVSTYESNDKFTFAMYSLADDKATKMMEIIYTRVKKDN